MMVIDLNLKKVVLSVFFTFCFNLINADGIDKYADDLETLNKFNQLYKKNDYNLLKKPFGKNSTVKTFDLKGKVHFFNFVNKSNLTEKFGEISDDNARVLKGFYEFDINGKIIKFNVIKNNGNESSEIWKYDIEGRLIENNHGDNKKNYLYNASNLLIQIDNYKSNTLVSRQKYKYDNSSNPIEISFYKETGDLERKYTYAYQNNRLVEEIQDFRNDHVPSFGSVKYEYNINGKKAEEEKKIVKNYGSFKTTYTTIYNYKYDLNNNLQSTLRNSNNKTVYPKDGLECKHLSQSEKDSDGNCIEVKNTISKSTSKYDMNNNEIEFISTDGYKEYTVFNTKGKITSVKVFNESGLKTTYTNLFDNHNNLTTEVYEDFKNGSSYKREKHIIEYDNNANIISFENYSDEKLKDVTTFTYTFY